MYSRLFTYCFAVAFSMTAFAQADRGTITGTVVDPAGAVVANATIQIRNLGTAAFYPSATSGTGNYTVAQLPAGNYELQVIATGFKQYNRSPLAVQVAQTIRVDVSLEVGSAAESITVTDQVSLLKTESGELSHNVTASTMNSLPILGVGTTAAGSSGIRNPNAVLRLIPGTYWAPNADIRINGAPSNTQSYRIEGQESANTGTPGTPSQSQPSVDAIQEMAVQTSNYAAEFGQAGGGYVNITMKSGTNAFHGSAYDYFVNEALNAATPFTDNGKGGNLRPSARRNDYGVTFGGPIRIPKVYDGKDKSFFFFNWEQFRETIAVNSQRQTVPTLAYRAGDFSTAIPSTGARSIANTVGGTLVEGQIFDPLNFQVINGSTVRQQFVGNKIPVSRFDPVAVKVQNLVPLPQGPLKDALQDNYVNSYPSSRITQIPSLKLDQSIGTKGKLSFFWQFTKSTSPISPTLGQSDGLPDPITTAIGTFVTAPLYRVNYDHTLTPTMLLHLGAGFRETNFYVPSVETNGSETNYDVEKELGLKGGITHRFFSPMTGMLATNGTGGLKNIGSAAGTRNVTQSPTFNASLTWVKNNHSFKFGSEFRTEGYPVDSVANTDGNFAFSAAQTGQPFQTAAFTGGANVGFGYASFLLGGANSATIANPTNPRLGKKQLGMFAQDTWKITRKLTFDYGIRYDYSTYLQEQYGRAPFFSPTTVHPTLGILGASVYDGNGTGRCNCTLAKNYPLGFAPRLGLAYQVNSKTVVRMGFGIVYSGTAQHNNSAGGLAGSSSQINAPSFGEPALQLANGIPASSRPTPWPNYNAAQFPSLAPTPGVGPVFMDQNAGRPARQYQWSIGVQRELSSNLVIEAAYVANRGVWWQAPGLVDFNAIQASTLAKYNLNLDNAADRTLLAGTLTANSAAARGFLRPYAGFPTGQTVAQSLRPFPQYSGANPTAPSIPSYWNPLGKTWYDSLQVKATKRLSHGLSLNSTFTWSRALALGSEREPNPGTTGSAVFNDIYNRQNNKFLSVYDIPFQFIVSANYQTPRLQAGHRALRATLSDWTYSVVLIYQSGVPIAVPTAQNTPALQNLVFQGTFAERVPGQPLFTVDPNCHCYDPQKTLLLNPKAWADPAAGHFGTSSAYYTDYRQQRRPNESMNFGRTFRMTERVTLNVRAEFSNILNRAFWNYPTATNAKAVTAVRPNGTYSSGFGWLNPVQLGGVGGPPNISPRSGTLVARVTF
ncbi:MAG: TonB-dependent receptor [Bryobacteraceae bacterium]